jgi:hypothetical protein
VAETDLFLDAVDQFGLAIALLMLIAVVLAFAFVKEWVVPGNAFKRERARGDEWERLFKKSVGYSDEQLQTTKQLATLADLVLNRAKGEQ